MTEVITFPDAVAAVRDYLNAQLPTFTDDAAVVQKIPNPRPTRLVKVNRTGGARLDLIRDQAQITVECWDVREDDAHDLAQVCRGLIHAMPGRYAAVNVYRVQNLGFTDLPDPDTASPRFTFTVLLDIRGAAL
jgi:hypothetical protein